MLPRLIQRPLALAASAAAFLLSAVSSAAPVSEQIIVDQFGWRASAPRKVVIFADPINGQNSAVAYTPGSSFQVRRVSDNATVFTGTVTSWNSGATQTQSGDKVWYGDFSSFTTAGDYYIYDPTNNLQSYNFKLDDTVFSGVLRASVRTFLYQRCGTAISSTHGGNWNHPLCHEGASQDLAALQWLNGAATGTARDVHGGWHDAGDMNKYVPFTANTVWDLMMAYEWNPSAFPDNWSIPESGNGVPDILDEIKYELDWLLRMQTANGSVMNRVAVTQYVASSPPNAETIARYWTQPTSWATAAAAAHFAHGARLFSSYSSQYPGYSSTLQTAATNAWNWLNSNPNMTPSNGLDGGGSGGSGGGLAAAGGDGNAGFDRRLRVLAAAELYKTTGNTTYRTYFDTWVKDPSTNDGTHNPLNANTFDPITAAEINRACVVYASTTGATQSLVDEIKTDLAASLNSYLGNYTSGTDAYRAFMYDGHYCWGSNQIKSQWGNLFIYGIKLNVNPANTAAYTEAAEEYLHYFHGRNPLSWVYLTNMGTKGANVGADKPVMQVFHGWFCDGSSLYDGASSTYGQAPGYLAGGPNQYCTATPPKGDPPMKAYRDWNTGYPDNSWEVTEPAIYYQAAYTLLLSNFVGSAPSQVVAPSFSPAAGTYSSAQSVTISTSTSGATIRYTTDGSTPTSSSGTVYSSPVSIAATTTLKAIAYKSGMTDSSVTTGVYTINTGGTGTGLKGDYYNTVDLTGSIVLTRTDSTVNFDWGSGSPGTGVNVDNFSVRWTGQVQATTTGNYTFSTTSDDGVRLWVNGSQVINNWTDHGPTTNTSSAIALTAGTKYNITMEYYERGGGAVAKLLWTPPGGSMVTIPMAQLYPAAAPSQVSAPTFSPAAGTYTSAQSVTISSATSGASIRYTTDGSTPTSSSGTVYSSPVTISATTTLKAIAYKSGMTDSTVTTGVYTINLPASYYIYQEAIATDWADWSWSATNNFANTSPVKNGTKSISTTFTAAWAGLSLHKGTAQSTSGYTSFKFWVHGGSSNKSLRFYIKSTDAAADSASVAFTATANTWNEITVPLSSVGNPTTVQRIHLADASGAAQTAFYVDDIRLAP